MIESFLAHINSEAWPDNSQLEQTPKIPARNVKDIKNGRTAPRQSDTNRERRKHTSEEKIRTLEPCWGRRIATVPPTAGKQAKQIPEG